MIALERHATLACAYLVLTATAGTVYALTAHVAWLVGAVGSSAPATWHVSKAAIHAAETYQSDRFRPQDWHLAQLVGVAVATLGVLGVLQHSLGLLPLSVAVVLLSVGLSWLSAGFMEYRHGGKTA